MRQRLTATTLYAGIPADALADLAIIAANKVRNGIVKFADFARQMVNEFGEKVKPELECLYREAMTRLGKTVDEAEITATEIDRIMPVAKVVSPAANAPLAKFEDYIFKPGATHGKNKIFESLGYGREHSQELAKLYEKQASEKFARGEYTLGIKDQYGQRINIEIELPGTGSASGKTSYLKSGWMIKPDGSISLNTPFSGFTK